MKHIGITGTRDGMSPAQWEWFSRFVCDQDDALTIHHGDCVGADADADYLADLHGATIMVHPPIDGRLRAYCTSTHGMTRRARPYLERNRDIVDMSERLLAFPREAVEQPKGGTWYTVRYARSIGRPVTIVWPDGTTS